MSMEEPTAMPVDGAEREQALVMRFHFWREPGVQASCIGVVRDSDPFNWFQGHFYVAASLSGFQTAVENFALSEKSTEAQRKLFDGLIRVEFLVFQDGDERATFDIEDVPKIHALLTRMKPLFDEYAILQVLQDMPHLHQQFFAQSNTFGTWADRCLHDLRFYTGSDFVWKRVGTDGNLLPLQSKTVTFKQSPKQARD